METPKCIIFSFQVDKAFKDISLHYHNELCEYLWVQVNLRKSSVSNQLLLEP